jgi:Fe-S-cluster containining protein
MNFMYPLRILTHLFQRYELLVAKADQAFHEMQKDYGSHIKCTLHCSDCCYAIFGLFLIEAAYLQQHFNRLPGKEKRAALLRGQRWEKEYRELEERIKTHAHNSQIVSYSLGRERIRCPLLTDHRECILYAYRPITCRVYGIPLVIQGKAHACGKVGFKGGEFYPSFNLDEIQRGLYLLSRELLEGEGRKDLGGASLLISVSKAIKTPFKGLISEDFPDS